MYKKIIGALINLFFIPGIGQLLIGQNKKGYKFIGWSLLLIIPFLVLTHLELLNIAFIFSIGIFVIKLISIIDIFKMHRSN